MELPFIKHLRDRVIGYRAVPSSRNDTFEVGVDVEDLRAMSQTIVRVEAILSFNQAVSQMELERSREAAGAAMHRVRSRAVRAIARQVYGPIETELASIAALLWQEGMAHHEACQRIEAMLPVLRGEGGE